MKYNKLLLMGFMLISCPLFASEIYKCSVDGKLTFQDFPCEEAYDYGMSEFATFDGWKYGMNILAFKKQAKERQLAVNVGSSFIYGKYNEKHINSNPDARTYSYRATVAGESANISLFFTRQSQALYQVNVTFFVSGLPPEEKKYFYASLVNHLSSKYGQYIEAKDYPINVNPLSKVFLNNLVGTEKVWGSNSDSVISLSGNAPSIIAYKLDYKFIPLLNKSIKETTQAIMTHTDKNFSVGAAIL
ncbi:hypothetical protein C9I86_02575 [Photobacterium sp. NCIMB 13483]|uniref:DUF4124 domain-containing protein n=1 Tax=Photobacterium piscicola TaxID=1378299 RepID=A0A1T5HW85_9GAMM|nr:MULTISPECIES: hypothetical protein [Photobacterium]PST94253.1 hypothetical protein C9I86_02575 [Photobacterium sp. NCIMB 13483]SKC31117.1 hypothetical protein CZ809_00595 [Photobacterium piscicola]